MSTPEEIATSLIASNAALVASNNALTNEVMDKMGGLVATANNAAATILAGFSSTTSNPMSIFVDNNAGDDANDGLTPQSALKSIARAVDMIPDGRFGQIYLTVGQIYMCSTVMYINSRHVSFIKNGDFDNAASNPKILVTSISDGALNHLQGQMSLIGGALYFSFVDLEIEGKKSAGLLWPTASSLISLNSSYCGHGTVCFSNQKITVADGNSVVRCHVSGHLTAALQDVDIVGDGFFVADANYGTLSMAVYSVTTSGGVELIRGRTTSPDGVSNVITNFAGTIGA